MSGQVSFNILPAALVASLATMSSDQLDALATLSADQLDALALLSLDQLSGLAGISKAQYEGLAGAVSASQANPVATVADAAGGAKRAWAGNPAQVNANMFIDFGDAALNPANTVMVVQAFTAGGLAKAIDSASLANGVVSLVNAANWAVTDVVSVTLHENPVGAAPAIS